MTIPVPQTFRDACERPRGAMRTDGEVGQFIVKQEAALADCDARRRGLVDLVDGANKAVAPKRKLFGFSLGF